MQLFNCWQVEAEISGCIVVADVAYHAADQREVMGDHAFVHILSQQVAQDAPEVFMAWIGEE